MIVSISIVAQLNREPIERSMVFPILPSNGAKVIFNWKSISQLCVDCCCCGGRPVVWLQNRRQFTTNFYRCINWLRREFYRQIFMEPLCLMVRLASAAADAVLSVFEIEFIDLHLCRTHNAPQIALCLGCDRRCWRIRKRMCQSITCAIKFVFRSLYEALETLLMTLKTERNEYKIVFVYKLFIFCEFFEQFSIFFLSLPSTHQFSSPLSTPFSTTWNSIKFNYCCQ